jgi:hypothetical protein
MLKALLSATTLAAVITLAGCEVKQTEEGRMPDVDVTVKDDGNLPKYDVDAPDVNVGTKVTTVTVPDVDVVPASNQ